MATVLVFDVSVAKQFPVGNLKYSVCIKNSHLFLVQFMEPSSALCLTFWD